jgi:DNA-directed RNA polymerase subunit beta'
VRFGGLVRGHRKLTVHNEKGGEKEYFIPKGAHLSVGEGERVKAGTPLMDGPVNPHDILKVLGEKELAEYLLREVQEVYRLQGVVINDKHIEVIIRQMLRWVKVEEVGDTDLLVDEQIDKFVFQEENEKIVRDGGKPAKARPLLLGITKSALSTDSFIAAASFQETTRVLTEASLYGKVDYLRRLKENIIMGRLIPAGTGYRYYRDVELKEEFEEELQEETDLSIPS